MPSPTTAVGRLLQPRNGEPRRHRVIAVRSGSVRTLFDRVLSHGQEAQQEASQGRQGDG